MKWIVMATSLVVAVIGGVWIAGSLLPEQHEAVFTGRISASRDAVYARLVDFASYPRWLSSTESVQYHQQEGLPAYTIHGDYGSMRIQVDAWDEPRRLVTRIAEDNLPFGGSWEYRLSEVAGGTELSITERGVVRSAFFRFVTHFFIGHTRTMENFFNDLASSLQNTPAEF